MREWWTWFVDGFCKVEFACHQGEPNWLGWLFISFGAMFLIGFIAPIILALARLIFDYFYNFRDLYYFDNYNKLKFGNIERIIWYSIFGLFVGFPISAVTVMLSIDFGINESYGWTVLFSAWILVILTFFFWAIRRNCQESPEKNKDR